jgi:hypothetical protein
LIDWKIGRLEDWKIGRLEDWKIERLVDWKIGGLVDWRIGRFEDWKIGGLVDYWMPFSAGVVLPGYNRALNINACNFLIPDTCSHSIFRSNFLPNVARIVYF